MTLNLDLQMTKKDKESLMQKFKDSEEKSSKLQE